MRRDFSIGLSALRPDDKMLALRKRKRLDFKDCQEKFCVRSFYGFAGGGIFDAKRGK
jgi:hypothetical protein